MSRRRLAVLVALVAPGGVLALLWAAMPGRYETVLTEGQQLVSDLPDSVVVAAVLVTVVVMWIAAMILTAKLLYWGWRQIDDYVLRVWDILLPESPIVRFGVGITIMIALFIFGPLVVIQAMEITSDDPINETEDEDANDTVANETTREPADDTAINATESTTGAVTGAVSNRAVG